MTDLFAQQGITFDNANVASSHPAGSAVSPAAGQPSMPKPSAHVNDNNVVNTPENDSQPIVSTAPKGNANMTDDEKTAAIQSLYGDGAASEESAAPAAPVSAPAPAQSRDLFAEQGIAAPAAPQSVTEQNQSALTAGLQLPAQTTDATKQPTTSSWAPVSKAEMSQMNFGEQPRWADQAAQQAEQERQSMLNMAIQRYGQDQVQQWQANPIGAAEAITRAVSEGKTLPWLGGIQETTTALRLQNIAGKNSAGEQLTPDDVAFANQYLHDQIEASVRGFTRGGKVAYTMSTIPAWLMEFAVADGAGKVVASSAERLAAGAPSVLSNAASGATRVASTAAFMPAQYVPAYAERQVNASTAITDRGQFVLKDSTESPAKSALMAYGYTAADVASALAGPSINKYVVEPSTRLLSTPIISASNALPASLRTNLYEAYKAIDPNASYSQIMTPAGWNSMLSALGSFQIDKILRSSVDYSGNPNMSLTDALKEMPLGEDDLLVAGGLMAIHGGISTGTSIASRIMQDRGATPAQATETLANMSAMEKENFVASSLNMPKSDYPEFKGQDVITPEQLAQMTHPEKAPGQYSDIDTKLERQTAEERGLRMSMLNQKMTAGIITPKEMYERDAIAAMIPKPQDQSSPATPEAIHYDQQQHPDAAEQLQAGQISATGGATPPPINAKQSGFNQQWKDFKAGALTDIYAELANDLQPIENLAKKAKAAGAEIPEGENSQLLTSFTRSTPEWIRRNQLVNTTTWDSNGNQVITGKGLKPIYDDFDNTFVTTEPSLEKRHADFDDYLIAQRLLEEKASGRNVLITDEQLKKSQADMIRLADKYGENFRMFDTYANEIRDWDNRILHNLVTSGLWTQERYDQTVGLRQHYSPLSRVVEEDFQQGAVTRSGIGKDVTPSRIGSLKQFKGSEKEIKNTFQSRLRNSALILQKSAVNNLRRNIAKYSQYYPEEIKVSNPAILRDAVKVSYDPKLRAKLEELVDFLDGDISRGKKAGPRGALGSYSPSENLIRLRLGTTEGTLAHEAGHMLDEKLGLQKQLFNVLGVKPELIKLASERLNPNISLEQTAEGTQFREEFLTKPQKYLDYIQNDHEIIANMFDAYVNTPDVMEKIAPKAKAAFEKIIDANPQLAFLKEIKPSTARAMEEIEGAMRDMKGPKDSLPVYIDGKRKYLEMSTQLYHAFNSMTPMQMGMVERFLGAIPRAAKRMLQFGATSSPDFMLRHFYRAIGTSFLNSRSGTLTFPKHLLVDMPKAVFAVLGKTELYHEWASSSGALQTFMDLSDKGLAKYQKEIFGEGMAGFLNPMKWLKTAKEVSDYAPRIAVFKKLKDAGESDLTAGLASLEATGNYIRHGSFVKKINNYSPFFNDMVQGGDRFVRSIARDPVGFSMRALATITIPQLVMTGFYLYAADDKTRDEYLNLPDWRRSVSFNVKIGDKWIPIPRYFAPGFVFGALPEKMMIWAYSGNHPELKNFWLRMMADTATSVSPVFDWTRAINPIAKSVLESITNYSFFMQRPLFSGDKEKTAPAYQYNQYSSETAKALGKMFGFSPIDIDNTIYDMSAKIGKYGTQLSDVAINAARKAAGQPVNEKPTRTTDNPIYGGLVEETPRGTGTEAYAEFREHRDDATQAHNITKDLKGEELANYMHQNARTLAAYPQINAINTQVMRLQHQIKLINSNTNISGDDKTERVNQLNDQITRIVEGANVRYRAMTKE